VTPDGVVTTLAGLAGRSGLQDGAGSAALFSLVSGVAVDGAGNVYAADTDNNTIRKVTLKGVVTTLAGLPGHTAKADGTGSAVRFMSPQGIAADQAGNIYVADALHDTICQITPAGVVTTLAGWDGHAGSADGMANGGGTPPAVPGANTISVATSRDQIIISQ